MLSNFLVSDKLTPVNSAVQLELEMSWFCQNMSSLNGWISDVLDEANPLVVLLLEKLT